MSCKDNINFTNVNRLVKITNVNCLQLSPAAGRWRSNLFFRKFAERVWGSGFEYRKFAELPACWQGVGEIGCRRVKGLSEVDVAPQQVSPESLI